MDHVDYLPGPKSFKILVALLLVLLHLCFKNWAFHYVSYIAFTTEQWTTIFLESLFDNRHHLKARAFTPTLLLHSSFPTIKVQSFGVGGVSKSESFILIPSFKQKNTPRKNELYACQIFAYCFTFTSKPSKPCTIGPSPIQYTTAYPTNVSIFK